MFSSMWIFLTCEMDEKQETAGYCGYSRCALPERTQAKWISSAEGAPDGPLCWLCRIMRLKNLHPGEHQLGLECRNLDQLGGVWSGVSIQDRKGPGLKGTGNAGKGAIILRSTTLPRVGEETFYPPCATTRRLQRQLCVMRDGVGHCQYHLLVQANSYEEAVVAVLSTL